MNERVIAGYEQRQIRLRAQVTALKAGIGIADSKVRSDRTAAIRRTQRQIADLDRAIMRLREKDLT